MRIFTAILPFVLICLFTSVQAVEPITDHQMMLYYEIPLGANKQMDKKHKFGLRFDQTMHDPREVADFSSVMGKPAMLDLQFRRKETLAFKVQGVDFTNRIYVQRADAGKVKAPAIDEADLEEGAAGVETAEEAEAEIADEMVESAEEGEAAEKPEAEVTEKPEEKKAEKTVVQKKLDELPFGVIIGVIVGIVIIAGIGG